MPLRNRVDPFGAIHAVAARGMFTGNRGVIHDPDTRTLLARRWTTRAWLICRCDYGERRRDVMGRNAPSGAAGWTELFFLDEVTALAAGHRPCFFCRREAAERYAAAFADARVRPKVAAMDALLHRQRLASGAPSSTLTGREMSLLPDGAMVAIGDAAYAVREGGLRRWTFWGYGAAVDVGRPEGEARLLTPQATVDALRRGYRPAWSPLFSEDT